MIACAYFMLVGGLIARDASGSRTWLVTPLVQSTGGLVSQPDLQQRLQQSNATARLAGEGETDLRSVECTIIGVDGRFVRPMRDSGSYNAGDQFRVQKAPSMRASPCCSPYVEPTCTTSVEFCQACSFCLDVPGLDLEETLCCKYPRRNFGALFSLLVGDHPRGCKYGGKLHAPWVVEIPASRREPPPSAGRLS